jgi:hypothetical protein
VRSGFRDVACLHRDRFLIANIPAVCIFITKVNLNNQSQARRESTQIGIFGNSSPV